MNIQKIDSIISELQQDFEAIQMARPPFVLEKFVVGAHRQDSEAQGWAHAVLEMKIKYDAIRRAQIGRKIILLEIEQLDASGDEVDRLRADLKRIDLEEQDRAELGAIREFEALYEIYRSFGRRYSREELNAAQPEYWQNRLTRQARQDSQATGRIGQGNQDALGQIGMALPGQNEQIGQVQRRYLAEGNRRLLIVIPTECKVGKDHPLLHHLNSLTVPAGIEYRVHNIYGMAVAAAYNDAALIAMGEGADYLLTIEDDTYPPAAGLVKLLQGNTEIIGGWYPKRQAVREGVPIILKDGKRQALSEPDGSLQEVYTIPQGFTLFKTRVFRMLPFPYFATTPQLSQDSYFSQLAREAGFKLICDTSVRCVHKDRETGVEYV